MTHGSITVISGPSGVGKDTVIRGLVAQHGFQKAISYTTRNPRSGEIDGADYRFIDEMEFFDLLGRNELLDHATVAGKHYGLGVTVVERLLQTGADIAVNAVVETGYLLRDMFPRVQLVFITPPDLATIHRRLCQRGMPLAEIRRRYDENPGQLFAPTDYDLVVENGEGQQSSVALEVASFVRRERYRIGA